MKVQILNEAGEMIWSQRPESEWTATNVEYLKDGTQEKIIKALEIALACAKASEVSE